MQACFQPVNLNAATASYSSQSFLPQGLQKPQQRATHSLDDRLLHGQPCFRQRQRHIGRRRRHLPAAAGDLSSANGSSGETGPGSSTPSAPPSSDEDSLSAAEAASQVKKFGQSEWSSLVLSLPLELAAANQRMDSHFLQKRKRKYWWSKSGFPKVPPPEEVHFEEPPLSIWQKALPLALIFFCASFNLTILQNLRDAIMVTTAGAETLPFLAAFVVLPASLTFFVAYGRMVEHLPHNLVFYASIAPLVAFYVFFATLLYPASAWLHPHGMYEHLAPSVPIGLHGLLKVVENWTFSLFFCISELWGSVVISVLFWSLANEVCSVDDAKTIYPLMGIAANIALVVAGNYMKWVNKAFTRGNTLLSLRTLVGTVTMLTVLMMAAKAFVDRNVKRPEVEKKTANQKKKSKGSFADSLAVLKSSPKIMNLALLVMSYGVSHRLFEFAWKGQLRVLYPSAQAYQGVLADVSIATGWMTIGLMLTGRFVFQYLGWGFAAAATPAVMLLSGAAFFGFSLASQFPSWNLSLGGMNLAAAGATAGAVTQVIARSAKFSLFDPAKEMVYIEMNKEEKSKGKAAVDLVGSQIGKSGASWITQALLLCLGSITRSLPIITATFLGVIGCWLAAVRHLNTQLKEADAELAASRKAKEAERLKLEQEAANQVITHFAEPSGNGASPGQHQTSHPARWPGSVSDALEDAGEEGHGAQQLDENTEWLRDGQQGLAAIDLSRDEASKFRELLVKAATGQHLLPRQSSHVDKRQ